MTELYNQVTIFMRKCVSIDTVEDCVLASLFLQDRAYQLCIYRYKQLCVYINTEWLKLSEETSPIVLLIFNSSEKQSLEIAIKRSKEGLI